MLRLLALDFDGVISDSAPESFVVAVGAYAELWPGGRVADAAARFGGGGAPALASVRAHPLYPPFLEAMPLGNRAEDYAVVLSAVEAGCELSDQAAYDALRSTRPEALLDEFHRRLYARRDALAASDPRGWHALMSVYPGIPELLRRRSKDVILAIATSKDRRSVSALLDAYGIGDLFDEARLLDKETGRSKTAHLERLHADTGVPFGEMLFVDDKLNHLEQVAALGVRCALADWGYNGVREITKAREGGYLVCSLASFDAQILNAATTP